MPFTLTTQFSPRGDQPQAITKLLDGYQRHSQQTLLGVTGSGKTFTMANVIARLGKPTLVLSHNKTLAAQLYQEFQTFFPQNKVCYFVSYYDYYQPESYIPQSDTYIEKDADINEQIERLRLEAATALLSRDDVIVVSSVSCIYGFGRPQDFAGESVELRVGQALDRQRLLKLLVTLQYERNDTELRAGRFRVRGDTVDIVPGFANSNLIRIEFFGDTVERLSELHRISGQKLTTLSSTRIYPARPYIVPEGRIPGALKTIRQELADRLPQLDVVEAYRLRQRTEYDLEMIEQLGYCKGIENYSRHFDQRQSGKPPFTLLDFFNYAAKDWLMIIDESHATIPQVGGMYGGDYSRKKNLIDYGFRLPSAFDNRPLQFKEFQQYLKHVIFVSATPAEYELEHSGQVVEQIIRPTGVVDPPVEVRPSEGQVDDLVEQIKRTTERGYRTLVTTLTKRMAEDLTNYLLNQNIKVQYLHSDIGTFERTKIIRDLRVGTFDVVIGINLLREGLDLPEVALVAVLDADKEGFLRNARSLIQTIGRAARNVDSRVILYAEKITDSMREAMDETARRRTLQLAYNKQHGITPASIVKAIAEEAVVIEPNQRGKRVSVERLLVDLEGQMQLAAENLEFEKAIELRDKIAQLKKKM